MNKQKGESIFYKYNEKKFLQCDVSLKSVPFKSRDELGDNGDLIYYYPGWVARC